MNISVDGGALCTDTYQQFGNYIFSRNLIKSLYLYDTKYRYFVYTFCDVDSNFHSSQLRFLNLTPKNGWMKLRISLEELTKPKDVFLALNQSLPLYTKAKKIVFSHGLSFLLHKDLYKHEYDRLKRQLDEYTQRADIIVVSSQRVRDELMERSSKLSGKIAVIPFGIPYEFEKYEQSKRQPFFLFCGNNHPIKNIQAVIKAFELFIREKEFAHYRLYLSGPFLNYASDNIIVITHQTSEELKNIYRTATAYLSSSLYESFNLPVLEALSQNCPVIAYKSAVIPELQPSVELIDSPEEMAEVMKKIVVRQPTPFDRKKLTERFSWKRYVNTLRSYYT